MDYGYNSALLTLTPHSTPDPFCVYANGSFYLTYTTNDHSKHKARVKPFSVTHASILTRGIYYSPNMAREKFARLHDHS